MSELKGNFIVVALLIHPNDPDNPELIEVPEQDLHSIVESLNGFEVAAFATGRVHIKVSAPTYGEAYAVALPHLRLAVAQTSGTYVIGSLAAERIEA